jgi:hypothetical protein
VELLQRVVTDASTETISSLVHSSPKTPAAAASSINQWKVLVRLMVLFIVKGYICSGKLQKDCHQCHQCHKCERFEKSMIRLSQRYVKWAENAKQLAASNKQYWSNLEQYIKQEEQHIPNYSPLSELDTEQNGIA